MDVVLGWLYLVEHPLVLGLIETESFDHHLTHESHACAVSEIMDGIVQLAFVFLCLNVCTSMCFRVYAGVNSCVCVIGICAFVDMKVCAARRC